MRNRFLLAAAALLALLFATNLYRAATQPIVHDEALTYNLFLAGPWSRIFDFYDANHHVLYTILCKISISLLGVSEFTMRLPSLLGGALYLAMALLISRYLAGDGWLMLLSAAFLTLNPFLLDFLSAARGYGLALGLWLLGLHQLLRYVCDESARPERKPRLKRLYLAALATGSAVAANLTVVFPIVAVTLTLLAALAVYRKPAQEAPTPTRKKQKRARRSEPWVSPAAEAALHYLVPAVVVAWLIVSGPIAHATKDSFYTGAASLSEMAHSLGKESLARSGSEAASRIVALTVPPLIFSAGLWLAWRARPQPLTPSSATLHILGGAVPLLLLLLVVAHYGFGLPYPQDRTGLYWIPLLGLVCAACASQLEPRRILAAPFAALLWLAVVRYAVEFDPGPYTLWRYDSATRAMVDSIAQRHATNPQSRVRVGATWHLEPALNFYRQVRGYDWMEPVGRQGPAGTYDYYLLWEPDRALLGTLRLTVLREDRTAGTVLAVPGR